MAQLEPGTVFEGKVTGITAFGAFVAMPNGQSGLVHISEIADTYVKDIRDHLQVGQTVTVKLLGYGEKNRINLSIKQAVVPKPQPERPPRPPVRPPVAQSQPQQPLSGDALFEDKLRVFMQQSDSRISDTRQRENRRNSGRRRR